MSDSVNINAVSQENQEEKDEIKVQPITIVPVVDIPPVGTGDASLVEEKKGSEIKATEQKKMVESSDLLECKDCGVEYEFSEREKKFYAKKKLSVPVRCAERFRVRPPRREDSRDLPDGESRSDGRAKFRERRQANAGQTTRGGESRFACGQRQEGAERRSGDGASSPR